jgi:hypothetical protein
MRTLSFDTQRIYHIKILIPSMPATGHLNPLLAITRILLAEGHEVAFHRVSRCLPAPMSSTAPARSCW